MAGTNGAGIGSSSISVFDAQVTEIELPEDVKEALEADMDAFYEVLQEGQSSDPH